MSDKEPKLSALVAGGSSGIGFAIARALRADGYEVTIAARNHERLETSASGLGAHAVAADLLDETSCAHLVERHQLVFGGLDVLVNSAGVGIASPVEALSAKHIDLQFGLNVRGMLLLIREAIPLLKRSRGWIVNIASIGGTRPTPNLSVYGASKAAVISLTRSLGLELEGDGVRAVAICPGFVDTPMTSWTGISSDAMIPPDDVAEVVRMCLRLGPTSRVPDVILERMGSGGALG